MEGRERAWETWPFTDGFADFYDLETLQTAAPLGSSLPSPQAVRWALGAGPIITAYYFCDIFRCNRPQQCHELNLFIISLRNVHSINTNRIQKIVVRAMPSSMSKCSPAGSAAGCRTDSPGRSASSAATTSDGSFPSTFPRSYRAPARGSSDTRKSCTVRNGSSSKYTPPFCPPGHLHRQCNT